MSEKIGHPFLEGIDMDGVLPVAEMAKDADAETQPRPIELKIIVSPENLSALERQLSQIIAENDGKDPFEEECFGEVASYNTRAIEIGLRRLIKRPEIIEETAARLLEFVDIEKTNAQNLKNALIKMKFDEEARQGILNDLEDNVRVQQNQIALSIERTRKVKTELISDVAFLQRQITKVDQAHTDQKRKTRLDLALRSYELRRQIRFQKYPQFRDLLE